MTEEQGEWLECVVDKDYQIFSEYPYSIKKKGSERLIKECLNSQGYMVCHLNNKQYKKHRIIGFQFIPNPNNLQEIDHINRIRTDNRIENLRWVSNSENNKNKTSNGHGRQYVFIDELPETAERLDSYNGHEFDGLWIDYENEKLYWFNGVKYREVVSTRRQGNIRYRVLDIENIYRDLSHKVLFG